jgi:hypothetical protein
MIRPFPLRAGFFPLIFWVFFLCPVQAQEDITQVADSAFLSPMRPPVAFHHDAHNERAGIIECNACHHVYENGKKLEDDDSVGMECSECHLNKDRNNTIDLIRAYHRQCGECHENRKSGPIMCGQCHARH